MLKKRGRKLTDCDSKKPETSQREKNNGNSCGKGSFYKQQGTMSAQSEAGGDSDVQFTSIAMGGDALFLEVL